jgi:hypothetical protein
MISGPELFVTGTGHATARLMEKLLEVVVRNLATSNEEHVSNESRIRTGNQKRGFLK